MAHRAVSRRPVRAPIYIRAPTRRIGIHDALDWVEESRPSQRPTATGSLPNRELAGRPNRIPMATEFRARIIRSRLSAAPAGLRGERTITVRLGTIFALWAPVGRAALFPEFTALSPTPSAPDRHKGASVSNKFEMSEVYAHARPIDTRALVSGPLIHFGGELLPRTPYNSGPMWHPGSGGVRRVSASFDPLMRWSVGNCMSPLPPIAKYWPRLMLITFVRRVGAGASRGPIPACLVGFRE